MNRHQTTMPRLVADPHLRFAESSKLESATRANPKGLGFK